MVQTPRSQSIVTQINVRNALGHIGMEHSIEETQCSKTIIGREAGNNVVNLECPYRRCYLDQGRFEDCEDGEGPRPARQVERCYGNGRIGG